MGKEEFATSSSYSNSVSAFLLTISQKMHVMLSPPRLRICKNIAKSPIDTDNSNIIASDHFFNEDITKT